MFPIGDDDSRRRNSSSRKFLVFICLQESLRPSLNLHLSTVPTVGEIASVDTSRIGEVGYWPRGPILSLMSACGLASGSSPALGFSPGFFAGVVGFAA
jgi:hypothetical protein